MAIIPLIIMGTIVTYIFQDSITSEIHDKASVIVDNLNDNINLFIEQNKNLVAFLSTTKVVRSMDYEQISSLLYDVTQQNPQVLRINVVNIENQSVLSVPYVSLSDDFELEMKLGTGALEAKEVLFQM